MTRSARGSRVTGNVPLTPRHPDTLTPSSGSRRLRLIGAAAALVVLLAGCASSPEASRVRGELGADPGNHGNPVVLLEPSERTERVYYEVPYDGPAAASEDTSQS
jgi:hypothetical protein